MSRRFPPLNSLKAFEAAARHLSFTRAADELYVTQAAVSHQIKALEEYLSMKLFIRRNRTLLLTEEGQTYFLELKDIFKSLQDATERLLARGSIGSITVATPPSFASQWLVPRINQFTQLHPDIDVKIQAVNFDEEFLTDEIDVAIYYGKGRWSGVQSDKLHTEFLTPLCSPSLFQSAKPLTQLSDLRNHVLLHDSRRVAWKLWLKQMGVTGVNVDHGPVFSHSMLVLQAATLGQGIALGNTLLARPELEAGRLIMPFEEKIESRDAYYLVCDELKTDLGKISAFRDWLLEQVEQDGSPVY